MKPYEEDQPIVLGLTGKAGSGKTTTADTLVKGGLVNPVMGLYWDHMTFATPLYQIATIKRKTQGELRHDRVLHAVHEVLYDLFGRSPLYGVPPYDDFTALVHTVADMPIAPEGQKARSFMQQAGDLFRDIQTDCFVRRMRRAILEANAMAQRDQHVPYVVVVSDVRFENEAEMIHRMPNSILIKLDADKYTLRERLEARDGHYMTEEELNHKSEELAIPEEYIDAIIDTSEESPEGVAHLARQAVKTLLEVPVNA